MERQADETYFTEDEPETVYKADDGQGYSPKDSRHLAEEARRLGVGYTRAFEPVSIVARFRRYNNASVTWA